MDNPINSLLNISMEKLKKLVDVDTIIGKPIVFNQTTIVPVTKVKLGFLSGGSEIGKESKPPFGGASGGNMTVEPICFIVITENDVKLLSLPSTDNPIETILKTIPKITKSSKSLFKDEAEGMKI